MRVSRRPMTFVADHGRIEVLHRHSDLVATAGFNGNFHKTGFVAGFNNVIVRNGFFSSWMIFIHGFDVQVFIFKQPRTNRARCGRWCSFDQSPVGTVNGAIVKLLLKVKFRFFRFGHHHDA